MNYQLPPDVDEQIKRGMASGRYSSEEDMIRQAFDALKWREDEVAAIQQGIEDMEAGRVKPLRDFDREFRGRHNIPQDA